MNLTALLHSHYERSGEQHNNVNLLVANALMSVANDFLSRFALYFVMTLICQRTDACNFYNDMLEKLFEVWDGKQVQIVNIQSNRTLHVPGKRDFNLILVDSYESFRSIDMASHSVQNDYNEYYYIVLHQRDHLIPEEMHRIFEYCWSNQLINCNVQIQTAKGEVLIYTYYPFTREKCGNVTTKLINEFNGTTMISPILFPNKLTNFHGCLLRVATWNFQPFMKVESSSSPSGSGRISIGIEADLLKELSSKMNFTIKVFLPGKEQRGTIMGKKTSGALRMLQLGYVDLSIGGVHDNSANRLIVSSTISYYQSSFIVLVKMAAHRFTSIETLLSPFACPEWILLIGIWLLSLFAITFLGQLTANQYCLNVFRLAIGVPMTPAPERNFGRWTSIIFICFTLIMRTAYLAILFHFLPAHLTYRLPQTLDDLIAKNYVILINRPVFDILENVPYFKSFKNQLIDSDSVGVQLKYLEKSQQKSRAAAGALEVFVYTIGLQKKNGVFAILPDKLVPYPITINLQKHSYLIDEFNRRLMRFRTMGLMLAWSRRNIKYNFSALDESKENRMNLDKLWMMFVITLVGYSFGVLCFMLEMFSRNVMFLSRMFSRV